MINLARLRILQKKLLCCCFVLFVYLQSTTNAYAQCQDSPAVCQPDINGHGPDPCNAKVYCSNSGAVEEGLINCTTAADTDGCGVEADADIPQFLDASLFINEGVPEDCYIDPDTNTYYKYVQWIKFATPPEVNSVKLQGVGQMNAWAVFYAGAVDINGVDIGTVLTNYNECNNLDYIEYACSDLNQWKVWANPDAVIDPDYINVYYIALLYDDISVGTINFKVKECELVCENVDITCWDSVSLDECTSQSDIEAAYNAWKDGFTFSGDPEATDNIADFPDLPEDASCGVNLSFTYIVTGGCEGEQQCDESTFTVAADTTAPVISVASSADPNGACNPDIVPPTFSVSDNCLDQDMSVEAETTGATNTGCDYMQTWTANYTDACGNIATQVSVTYTWTVDVEPPSIVNCPPGGDLGCNPSPDEYAPGEATWSDNCGIANSGVNEGTPEITDCSATVTHTYWVEDDCGNTNECTQTFTWTVDEDPPVIADIDDYQLEECNGDWPALKTTWTDGCGVGGQTSGEVDGVPGEPSAVVDCYQTLVYTFTVTDDCGNVAQTTTTVTRMVDEDPPVIVDIDDYQLEECNGDWPELKTTWTDGCGVGGQTSGEVDGVPGEPSAVVDCYQTLVYTFTVTDDCGNVAQTTTTVTRMVDEDPPVIVDIDDYQLEECNGDWPELKTTWTDGCGVGGQTSGEVDGVPGEPSAVVDCYQTLVYTFTVTDDCGNVAQTTTTVTRMVDEDPPVIVDIDDYQLEECNGDWPELKTTWTDGCGVGGQTSGEVDGVPGEPSAVVDCYQTLVYTFTVTDDCGNVAQTTTTVTRMVDEDPPVIVDIDDYQLEECNGDWPELKTTWTDGCGVGGQTSGEVDGVPGEPSAVVDCYQTLVYTFTVTDDCGNVAQTTTTVTRMVDEDPPVIADIDDYQLEECNGDWPELKTTWTDGCGVGGQTSGEVDGVPGEPSAVVDCYQTLVYTFTVTDDCGNVAQTTTTVTRMVDEDPPVIADIDDYQLEECNGDWPALKTTWTDGCGVGGQTSGEVDGVPGEPSAVVDCYQTLVYTFTVTDDCGNVAQTTTTVSRIVDVEPPSLVSCPPGGELGCNPEESEYAPGEATWSDNCGIADSGVIPGEPDIVGCDATVTHTYWVIDDCGNTSECTQTFTWTVDTTPPEIQLPEVNLECNEEFPDELFADWTDNCSEGGKISAGPTNITTDIKACIEYADYIFEVTDDCGNTTEETLKISREFDLFKNCETAFGRYKETNECFIPDFKRWGWTNYIAEEGSYTMGLYAGAAHCDYENKGELVGYVYVDYADGQVTVEYDLLDGYVMSEAHVYVGCEMYPENPAGNPTVAPGQYNFKADLDFVNDYTIGPIDVEGPFWIIVHAVTCEELCRCSDSEDEGGTFTPDDYDPIDCEDDNEVNSIASETEAVKSMVDFTAYPVPFVNNVIIDYKFNFETGVKIEVYDMLGNIVQSISNKNYIANTNGSALINLSNQKDKVLFVKLTTNQGVKIKKLIPSNKR